MGQTRSTEENLKDLPRTHPRHFVKKDADLLNLTDLRAHIELLLSHKISSKEELEKWLMELSEFNAAFNEASSILYILMTCQTDEPKHSKAYHDFITHVLPQVKPLEDKLNRKYLDSIKQFGINQRYDIHTRSVAADVGLFVEKNIKLQTQVDVLSQEYQTLTGAMMVDFEGKERTLPEMGKFLEETDQPMREAAWRASSQRRLKDKERLEDIFDEMLKLRHQIAQNAGFNNYRDYMFKALHRFDYTPDDCQKYHASVENLLAPLWRDILRRRKHELKLESLRPWDTSVDPHGRQPLKPFTHAPELIAGCKKIFHRLNAEFGREFDDMAALGLLDLESRKGKAPGGYHSPLQESRKPFIFMNAVGTDGDVRTLLHEAGHAFHSLASSHEPLFDYRHAPMEFNEVASMAMEILGGEYLSFFYNDDDEKRSRQEHLEDIVFVLNWVAAIDSFQHWIYENPTHSRDERKAKWMDVHKCFNSDVIDWSGLETERGYLWHRQLHIFEVPFYYIEYGIAQLGALQVWLNSRINFQDALKHYKKGLALGGSKPLPEIYQTAGIFFDFSEKTIAPLAEILRKELKL